MLSVMHTAYVSCQVQITYSHKCIQLFVQTCPISFMKVIHLAHSANLPAATGLYILLALISFLGTTGPTFAILFKFLKGRCHGNQLKAKNRSFSKPIYFVALPFQNGLQYCNYDFNRLNRTNFSTSCTILVTFGPVTSETARVITALFGLDGKNRHI